MVTRYAPLKDSPNLKAMAKLLASKGKGQDTMLVHITPHEAEILKANGGSGTINPETGLRQYDPGDGGDAGDGSGGPDSGGNGDGGGKGDKGDTPDGGKDEGDRARDAAGAAAPEAGPFGGAAPDYRDEGSKAAPGVGAAPPSGGVVGAVKDFFGNPGKVGETFALGMAPGPFGMLGAALADAARNAGLNVANPETSPNGGPQGQTGAQGIARVFNTAPQYDQFGKLIAPGQSIFYGGV